MRLNETNQTTLEGFEHYPKGLPVTCCCCNNMSHYMLLATGKCYCFICALQVLEMIRWSKEDED